MIKQEEKPHKKGKNVRLHTLVSGCLMSLQGKQPPVDIRATSFVRTILPQLEVPKHHYFIKLCGTHQEQGREKLRVPTNYLEIEDSNPVLFNFLFQNKFNLEKMSSIQSNFSTSKRS